jgi:nicotinate-nucleotide--dimethylbenzimidazole phosphoribosyltransferase
VIDPPTDRAPGPNAIDVGPEDARRGFDELVERIDYPDGPTAQAVRDHWAAVDRTSALGDLESLAAWLAGGQGRAPAREFRRARLIVVAGDHGIADTGTVDAETEPTARRIAAVRAGTAPVCQSAELAECGIRVVDVSTQDSAERADRPEEDLRYRVRSSSGRIDREDALSDDEVWRALAAGIALVDAEIDAGTDLIALGSLGRGGATAAAALVSALTAIEPVRVVDRNLADAVWARRCVAVRDARRRSRADLGDVPRLLARIGGADLAALVGMILQAAARRTPVLLDGDPVVVAAALAAYTAAPRTARWTLVGHDRADPAARAALDRMGLDPVLSLGIRDDGGLGAMLALSVLRTASRITERAMARTAD